MATTYYSDQITTNDSRRYNEKGNYTLYGTFTLTAALVINDVIQMVRVPNGARVVNMEIYSDDLDSGGPTILFDVGDGSVTDRFGASLTLGQSAGFVRGIQTKDGFGYQYTADDTIDLKVHTAPTTGATSGDIIMRVDVCNDV